MAASNIEVLASAERRIWRAMFEDGVADVLLGIMLLLVAGGFWAPSGFRLPVWAGVIVAVLALDRAGKAAKRKLVVPRTGFVRPPRPKTFFTRKRLLLLVTGSYALTGLIALIQLGNPALPSLFPLMPFAMWVAVFLLRAWKTVYARYCALAVALGIAAAIAWPVEEGSWREAPVLFSSVGVGLVVGGIWTLRGYLRLHPLAFDET